MIKELPQILAYGTTGDGRAPLGITEADRSRHIFAIGQTGVGKSTFLRNLVLQDVARGGGFSFFDPHGEDARELLDYIPTDRINDVHFFRPADTAQPFGINLLEGEGSPEEIDLIVSSVIESLRQAWPDAWGPRMEHILRNSLYALAEVPGSTLLHVAPLLVDEKYRRVVTEKVSNPAVRHFWKHEFTAYDYRFRVQVIAPIQNKLGYIASNSLLRNIFGQAKTTFNISSILDEDKIFITDLSGIGSKEADFIGSMLLTQYHIAAMRRGKENRTSHHIYLDEVHRFSTPTLASMLSEIRKFGVSLTMAQQFLDQNNDELVRKALLGNVGTLAVYRVAPKDSRILSEALDPDIVSADTLTTLGVGELYIRTSIDGKQLTKRAKTRAEIHAKRYGKAQSFINNSRLAWGRPVAKINKRIERIFNGV